MKIGLDIDGIKADMMPKLNAFYNRRNGTSYRIPDYKSHDLEKTWGIPKKEVIEVIDLFYQSRDFLAIRPVIFSENGTLTLSKKHQLFSVTSRPRSVKLRTEIFINRYFPNRIKDIFFTGQYTSTAEEINKFGVCHAERADLLIEDCLETAISCAERGLPVFLLDAPWNQLNGQHPSSLPENLTRVKNWPEIIRLLK